MTEIRQIKKRDGRTAPFDQNKIAHAIGLAFGANYDTDYSDTADDLAQKVTDALESDGELCPTVEHVQDLVEQALMENGFAQVAKSYIIYRSDRSKVREMKTHLMQTYKELTFSDAKDSDVKRENANIDGNTAMGTMLKYGSEGSKHFYKMFVAKPEHAKAHDDGDIHIHDMDFAPMGTTTCTQIDLLRLFKNGFCTGHGALREPNDISSYAALACIAIQSNQNDQHGGQAIVNFDYSMAQGVAKTFKKFYRKALVVALHLLAGFEGQDSNVKKMMQEIEEENGIMPVLDWSGCEGYFKVETVYLTREYSISEEYDIIWKCQRFAHAQAVKDTDRATYQAMEALIHNLNTMHSRAGAQTPFSSINYGMDTSPEARMVVKNLLLATEAGLGNGETPIFPIQIYRVKEGVNYNPGDPNYDLFKLAIRCSAKRLFPNFSFVDAPFNLQYYKPGHPETEIAYMGCADKDEVITIQHPDGKVETIGIGHAVIDNKGRTDVKVWDSHAGKFVCVKTWIENPDMGNWYHVKFSNGRALTLTADHPLPTQKGRTYVKDLEIGDQVPLAGVPVVEKEVEPPVHPWILGLMVCDGSYANNVTVYLGMDERDIAGGVAAYCGEEYVTVKEQHRGKRGDYLEVHIRRDSCMEPTLFENLFNGVAKIDRTLPLDFLSWSRENRIALLAGIVDADGYVNTRKGCTLQIGSTNKELALQQLELLRSLGVVAKMYENKYKSTNGNQIRYRVEGEAPDDLWLVSGKKSAKLSAKRRTSNNPELCKVTEITFLGSRGEKSYDLETESDRFDLSGINSHNCRTRVIGNVVDPTREVCNNRGNLSFTTVNLPRLAIKAKGDIDVFFDGLDHMLDLCVDQLLDRFEFQCRKKVKNFPFLMGQGVWMDSEKLDMEDELRSVLKHGTLSVGFIGLAEALKCLIGEHHGESEKARNLGLEIISHMRSRMDKESENRHLNFSLLATPAEGLSGRFVRIDKVKYGIIPGVTDRDYYTNSFHVPVYYPISAFDKIAIEAPYHALTNAGHISYIEMDGDPTENLDAFEAVIRCMKEKGIGYGSVNHPVDRDPVCGFSGIIGDQCPGCGRTEGYVPFERIRRITGYLVGTLDRFNNAKRAEVEDRVKHGVGNS